MLKFELGHIKQLLYRLGISLLGLFLIRLLFLIYNWVYYNEISLSEGISLFVNALRFDLISVTYANGLLIIFSLLPFTFRSRKWYQLFLKTLFIVFNSVLFFIEIMDVVYYQYSFRRTIFSDIFMFSNNQSNILDYFKEYWLFVGILFLMIYGLYSFIKKSSFIPTKGKWYFQFVIFLIGIGLGIIAARGGIGKRPITPIDAAQYTTKAAQTQLITNTTLNLIFSFQQRTIKRLNYYSNEELSKIFPFQHNPKPKLPFDNKNVVILIMESLSKEYTGTFENTSYTPFLDSLMEHSFYLKNTFANGLRSTEGIAAITAGLPHLMHDPFIFSAYQTNKIDAIAGLLKKKGYQTAFFHGSFTGTMNFDALAKLEGFDDYYSKETFDNPKFDDGHWGIWDIPFFEYTAEQLNNFKTPFFASLFSLTSHHPYNVEDWFKKEYPDMDIQSRTVLYADLALKRFFEKAKASDWYENTIFIILGDHTGPRISKPYQTSLGQYKIPIVLFDPSGTIKGEHEGVAQQLDLLPTIMSYLNYDLPYNAFGQNMLDTTKQQYAYMRLGVFQICDEQYLLKFNGKESIALYDYQKDILLNDNLIKKKPQVVKRLETALKARLQRYNNALIDNKLSIE